MSRVGQSEAPTSFVMFEVGWGKSLFVEMYVYCNSNFCK